MACDRQAAGCCPRRADCAAGPAHYAALAERAGELEEASPYANICETCDNFVTSPEFAPALRDQLTYVRQLHADAQSRGWDMEAARHARVAGALTDHLARLEH